MCASAHLQTQCRIVRSLGRSSPRRKRWQMLCFAFHMEDFWMKLSGKCFCGAVEIEVSGSPEAMGYCHCNSCRSWSGGPVNAFSLWQADTGRITRGQVDVATLQQTAFTRCQ